MADPSNGITFRTIQEAMPEYHISASLLDGLLIAMPPPPPGASAAWCRERLALVIDEIAARVPMDAAQGHLAAQCVLAEFLAEDMAARGRTPGLSMMEMRQVSGAADRLMCTVTRMERALERRQMRVMPFRDTKAVDGFDLDALEGIWRGGMSGLVAADPRDPTRAGVVQRPAAPVPVPVGVAELMGREPVAHEPERLEPMEPAVAAVPGRAEAAHERGGPGLTEGAPTQARDARSRAGVTLEQGDGWSVERWPAGAGVLVGLDRSAGDRAAGDAKGAAGGFGGGAGRGGAA